MKLVATCELEIEVIHEITSDGPGWQVYKITPNGKRSYVWSPVSEADAIRAAMEWYKKLFIGKKVTSVKVVK